MVLEKLSQALKEGLNKLAKGSGDKEAIIKLSSDIKDALIAGDVNVQLAKDIAQKIRDRALGEKPAGALTIREHTINIVYEELTNFLGKEQGKLSLEKKPTVVLLVGLFGSGKTTTAGKLARLYKKQGLRVALLQTDTWRPAAFQQLKQLAEKSSIQFFGNEKETKPENIVKEFKGQFNKFDLVIVDSAGRDALNSELIEEIKRVDIALNANEKLLVLSGDIGQGAQNQAQAFHDAVKVTGVIVTKLDGTAKGGGALSACAVTNTKVKFIGLGEKLDALEEFKPKNFVSQLLGMGDIETLLQKAESAIDKEAAEKVAKKVSKGEALSLQDLYDQMESLKKMGPLSQIMNLVPGMSGIPKDMLKGQEKNMENWKYLMDSMTKEEKENPEIIKGPRITRIAKGSGRDESELRGLLKQYAQMKKLMKGFSGRSPQMRKLAKMMGKDFKLPGMGEE